jgi:hypothetical protein
MTAPHIIPFNFMPTTTPAYKTAQYTVPSTSYALVEARNFDLALNTVEMFPNETISLQGVNTTATSWQFQFTTPFFLSGSFVRTSNGSGVTCSGQIYLGSSSAYSKAAVSKTGAQAGTFAITSFNSNAQILLFTITQTTGNVTGDMTFNGKIYYATAGTQFWVAPGTVIDGTGFVVTEYMKLS